MPRAPNPSPPTGLIPRFSAFIERMVRGLGDGIGRRHDTLGPLGLLLWKYLGHTGSVWPRCTPASPPANSPRRAGDRHRARNLARNLARERSPGRRASRPGR